MAALTPRRLAVRLSDAIVGLSGLPARHLGWRQFRALGHWPSTTVRRGRGPPRTRTSTARSTPTRVWDYLGELLVCREAGATVVDARGRDLVVLDPAARRTPVAGSAAVVEELVAAWPSAVGSVVDRVEAGRRWPAVGGAAAASEPFAWASTAPADDGDPGRRPARLGPRPPLSTAQPRAVRTVS